MTTTKTTTELMTWARNATAGEYLARYEGDWLDDVSDSGSRCGYGDDQLDAAGRILRGRDLRLTANDRGLVVESTIDASALAREVAAIVGHDGSADIRTIVDCAIADGVTDAAEIAEIVRTARADAAAEAAS